VSTYKTLITEDRLKEIVRLAKTTPEEGIVVELGVYKGGSLLYLAEQLSADRSVIGFDTFEGLPKEHWNTEEIHTPGDFNDTSWLGVCDYLLLENKRTNILLIEGLFPESAKFIDNEDVPVSFVHVDFDFYEGAKAAIEFFKDKMVRGGVMVFDDYEWPNCPGVKKALDESNLIYQPTEAKYQAYIQF
jgi:hypothetical protein